jgi:hypothetical protein
VLKDEVSVIEKGVNAGVDVGGGGNKAGDGEGEMEE